MPTRQCGDSSDPTYKESPRSKTIENPPHGSVGMVQIQPTKRSAGSKTIGNPPHGSVGIVQILPCIVKGPSLFSLHVPHTLHKPGLGLPASLLSLFSHASPPAVVRFKSRSTHGTDRRDLCAT